jgi:hypothetical protein
MKIIAGTLAVALGALLIYAVAIDSPGLAARGLVAFLGGVVVLGGIAVWRL